MRTGALTLAGGWLAVCGGVVHLVGSVWMRRDAWSQIADEGFVGTVTLDPSADRMALSEAFWFSLGSFGMPILLIGALTVWLHRRGQRVPGFVGWGIVGWAGVLGLVGGFDAGTFAILLIGALLAAGDLRRPATSPVDEQTAARPVR